MNSTALSRKFALVFTSVLILAGCGGDDESAPATSAPTAAVEVEAPSEDTSTTTIDTRTDRERIIDRLDVTMFQLGVEPNDLEGMSNCVVDRLESENIELTGEGTAELIALARCDPSVITSWMPQSNPALPADTWACTVDSIGDWINELSIPEAQAFFNDATPSAEFVDTTADRCDVSAEELTAAL